jgi:hypothetical protein
MEAQCFPARFLHDLINQAAGRRMTFLVKAKWAENNNLSPDAFKRAAKIHVSFRAQAQGGDIPPCEKHT